MYQEDYREALRATLDTMPEIKSVYDYPEDKFDGFPSVVVNSAGWESTFADTHRNRYIFHFELYLFQAVNESVNEKTARLRIDAVMDAIIRHLKGQVHLGGAIKVEPLLGTKPDLVERPDVMIMSMMIVNFHSLIAR